ncbi:MAG: phage minor head protein [Euryarchaeota archaeon]|nr:phage minor head protein [Euryarchaeota archaeon]
MDEIAAVTALLRIVSPSVKALRKAGYFYWAEKQAEADPEVYVSLALGAPLRRTLARESAAFFPVVLEEIPSLRGRNYFKAHGLNQLAGQMADTDIKYLKKLFIDNWPVHEKQAAKLIGESPLCSPARARRIARTEKNRAINGSRFEKEIERGIYKYKIWDAVGDRSTRPLHKKRDGVKVRLDEPFPYGGRPMFPGDGPGFESVNCRCVLGYSTNSRGAHDSA